MSGRCRSRSIPQAFAVTCHPDHMASLMKAKPADAPSLTGESPLRPLLGPNSVLTSIGDRHMRQRKLLLPPFHGEAIQQLRADDRRPWPMSEIDRWPIGTPFALAPRMQDVTLAVIMRGVFGMRARPAAARPRTGCERAVPADARPHDDAAVPDWSRCARPVTSSRASRSARCSG